MNFLRFAAALSYDPHHLEKATGVTPISRAMGREWGVKAYRWPCSLLRIAAAICRWVSASFYMRGNSTFVCRGMLPGHYGYSLT